MERNAGGGDPGGGKKVPRVVASPRRPLPHTADARDGSGPAAELAHDGGPGYPAHSHRGGADGIAAGGEQAWGLGLGARPP